MNCKTNLKTGHYYRLFEAQYICIFQVERNYILDETKTLFRKNAGIKSSQESNERYREAEARLAMAEHYR